MRGLEQFCYLLLLSIYSLLIDKRDLKILGKELAYQVHPAFRRYTIYRNRVTVIKEYSTLFPDFLVFEVLSMAKDLFKLALLEDQKFNKLRSIFIGIMHGMTGSFTRGISHREGHDY